MPDTHADLARRFGEHRPRLHGIATRMLGSPVAADDAVQTAWLRLTGTDSRPDNVGGWLTTAVSRVAIDMLRARHVRDHDVIDDHADPTASIDPAEEAELADAVGAALWVVLVTLSPAERLALCSTNRSTSRIRRSVRSWAGRRRLPSSWLTAYEARFAATMARLRSSPRGNVGSSMRS